MFKLYEYEVSGTFIWRCANCGSEHAKFTVDESEISKLISGWSSCGADQIPTSWSFVSAEGFRFPICEDCMDGGISLSKLIKDYGHGE